MTSEKRDWNEQHYHGWTNRYPFTDVVSFVLRTFGKAEDRSKVKILDLGCGAAHHLRFLAQEGFDYYGIDGASKAIEIAHEQLRSGGFGVDNVVVGTFDALPWPDDFFDGIIDRGALVCNRRADLKALLGEVKRVLKPGGQFMSSIIHEESSIRQTGEDLGDGDYANFQGRLEGAGVLHFTNADDARDLFGDFKIVDIETEIRRSEHPPAGNTETVAWTIVRCSK